MEKDTLETEEKLNPDELTNEASSISNEEGITEDEISTLDETKVEDSSASNESLNKKKKPRKKMSLRKKIILSIVGLFVVAIGIVAAYFITSALQPPAEIEDTDAQFQTTLLETPTDGTGVMDHTLEENVAYALWLITQTSEFSTITTGTADASVATQEVYNKRVVKDGKAMVTMITNGLVKQGKQRYFLKDKVLLRDATTVSVPDSVWSTDEPECVSYKTIKKRYGWLPTQATGYIICSDTYTKQAEQKIVNNGDGTYRLIFDLDPDGDKAPFWYRREVLTNGSSTIIPEFYYIHVELTIDSSWRIITNDIQEQYKVKAVGVEAVTKTNCHEEFQYTNVEFDKDAYDYFESYAWMSVLDDSDDSDDIKLEMDPGSIIVDSLQKTDGSDTVLDLSISYGDFKTSGTVALNISDLQNIKVLAKLDKLYVEYTDSIYISIGGVKVKANVDELTNIIGKITALLPKNEESDTSSLDVDKIMKDLNASVVHEDENGNVVVNTTLDIAGIILPITFEIKHDLETDKYTLKNASVVMNLNEKELRISIKATDNKLKPIDHSDFANLSNIEFVVDSIVDIIEKGSVDIKATISYDTFTATVLGTISFKENINANLNITLENESNELKLSLAYENEIIYLSLENVKVKISKEDLEHLIAKYSTGNSIDIDAILSTLDIEKILTTIFEIDYDALLKELVIDEDYMGITLGLSEFKESLGELKASISKKEENLALSIDIMDIDVDLCIGSLNLEFDPIDDQEYQNLLYLEGILDEVLVLVNEKKFSISMELEYQDLHATVEGILDFNTSIQANISILVNYKEISLPLGITYYNDSLYVTLENNKVMLSKDAINSILGLFMDTDKSLSLDVKNILNTILTIDFDKIIEKFSLTEELMEIDLDLSSLSEKIGKLQASLSAKEKKIFASLSLMDIAANITVSETEESILPVEDEYISLDVLLEDILEVVSWISKENLTISLSGDAKLSSIELSFQGNIDLILDEEKNYQVDGHIHLSVASTEHDLYVKYKNNTVYLSYGGLHIGISLDDMESFIKEIMEALELEDTTLSIDYGKLNKVLESLEIQSNSISVDLSEFVEMISKITIALNYLSDEDMLKANISSNVINIAASVEKLSTSHEISLPESYIDNSDVIKLCKMVKKIISLKDERDFNLDFALNVYDNELKHLAISGTLDLHFETENWSDFKFSDLSLHVSVSIKEYKENGIDMKVNHLIDITLVDSYLYIEYGTTETEALPTKYIKLKSKESSILSIAASLMDVLGVNIDFFNEYRNEILSYVDFSNLKDLVGSLMSSDEKSTLNISDKIDSFLVKEDGLSIILFANLVSYKAPSDKKIIVNITQTEETPLIIELYGLYTDYANEKSNTRLEVEHLEVKNQKGNIESPSSLDDYYDISDLDKLVDGLLITASNQVYEISGTVTMVIDIPLINKIPSLGTIDVPIEAKVEIDENGAPIIYVHLDLNNLPSLDLNLSLFGYGKIKLTKKDTYIYYQDGFVYIHRVDNDATTYDIKVTYQEFFDDIMYYLLEFSMGMPDAVMSAINTSKDDNSDFVVNAGNVIKKYSYNDTSKKFSIGLSLEALTGNSNLGDLSLGLKLHEVALGFDETGEIVKGLALTEICDLSVNLVSVIDISSNSLGLTLKTQDGNDWFTNAISLESAKEYIASYLYDTDIIYINGEYSGKRSHSITFITLISDSIQFSAQSGTQIIFPEIELVYKEDENQWYLFDGWYLDKYCETPFTQTSMGNSNLKVYAKWKKVSVYSLDIISMDGNTSTTAYEGKNLSGLLSKNVYTSDDNKTYILKGYSMSVDLSDPITDISSIVMPSCDTTLYAIWEEITYKLYIDGTYVKDITKDMSLTMDYELKIDDVYYLFDSSMLNYDTLLNVYGYTAVISDDIGVIHLYTPRTHNDYYTITLDYDYAHFDDKRYKAISLPLSRDMDPDNLPYKIYDNYQINYWFNENLEYHYGTIASLPHENITLKAYYASSTLTFTMDYQADSNGTLAVNGYTNIDSSNIVLIFPKYVLFNGEYLIVKTVMAEAFKGTTNIQTIYFNEGLENIMDNAFLNSTGLSNVYFADTIKNVSNTAFFFDNTKYESQAKAMRFHFEENHVLDVTSWQAVIPNNSSTILYYGKKQTIYNGWWFTFDFTSAAKDTYSGSLENIIHDLF